VHEAVVCLIIYFDDVLILTKFMKAMLSVKKQLSNMYMVKDLGEAEYFRGVKIERESSSVKLTKTSTSRASSTGSGRWSASLLRHP
jgi:hypothetical protein